jgi:hypothetical protein
MIHLLRIISQLKLKEHKKLDKETWGKFKVSEVIKGKNS